MSVGKDTWEMYVRFQCRVRISSPDGGFGRCTCRTSQDRMFSTRIPESFCISTLAGSAFSPQFFLPVFSFTRAGRL